MRKPKTHEVSNSIRSKYKTISQAIDAASDGDIIKVKPGIYRESLSIRKPLMIAGDGGPGEVVIESSTNTCIQATSTTFHLHGLTIRQTGAEKHALYAGVSRFTISNCMFSSEHHKAIYINNCQDFKIKSSVINNSQKGGVLLDGNPSGSFESCDFSGFSGADSVGLHVNTGHDIHILDCSFTNGNGVSIHFDNRSSGSIRDCSIDHFKGSLAVTRQSNVNIEHSKIHHLNEIFYNESFGELAHCDIHHMNQYGIISRGSDLHIHNCNIYSGDNIGVTFDGNSTGRLIDCEISDFHNGASVYIVDSDPVIRNCRIHNGVNGIVVRDGGKGTIEDCKLFSFKNPAIAVIAGGNPTINYTEVSDNHSNAVSVQNGGKAEFESCTFHTNLVNSPPLVEIAGPSEASFADCLIYASHTNGMQILNGGKALIEDCEFRDTVQVTLFVNGGNALIRRSVFHDGKNTGIFVKNTHNAIVVEDCEFHDYHQAGFVAIESTNITIRNTNFHNCMQGIGIADQSAVDIENVNASNNNDAAILVQRGSSVSIRSLIADNNVHGLYVDTESKVEATDVKMDEYSNPMVVAIDDSTIHMRNGFFSNGQDTAFLANNQSTLLVTACEFVNMGNSILVDDTSQFTTLANKMDPNDLTNIPAAEQYQQKERQGEPKEPDENEMEVLGELNEFIGLENVKKSIRDTVNFLDIAQKRRNAGFKVPFDTSLNHAVFYGNPGTGKTSVARVLGKVYQSLGLLEKGHVVEVNREHLVGQYIGHSEEKTSEKIKEAYGGILFIDEAYTLVGDPNDKKDFGRKVIDTLLPDLENNKGKYICIIAGYEKEMQDFMNANPGLSSRFKDYFHFEDYTPDELMEIASRIFTKYDFELEEQAKQLLYGEFVRLYRKRDEKFDNARMANDVCNKVIRAQAKRLAENPSAVSNESLIKITEEDVRSIIPQAINKSIDIPINEELLKKHTDTLNGLVGLEKVKTEIYRLIKLVRYYKEEGKDLSSLTAHLLLTGNPGTGKTEVGKIIGGIYEALGILERGVLVEVDREGLVDKYRGGTEEKTVKVIEKAMGGTLFIDEAYTLTNKSSEDPGHAAVEILLKRMEDNRGQIVVLAAGYEEEMESFLDSNKGLRRRFDKKLIFDDYKPDEMMQITLILFQKNRYTLAENAKPALLDYYTHLYDNRDRTYGNAGLARRIALQAIKNLDYRLSQTPMEDRTDEMKVTIEEKDLGIVFNH